MYREPKAAGITNSIISPFFSLTRGTHQGCSLNPLLFNVFIETIAVSIRTNGEIKGILSKQQEHKLLLHADDILALITHPLTFLPHLMETIQSHSKISGHTINWIKSEDMPLSALCKSYGKKKK